MGLQPPLTAVFMNIDPVAGSTNASLVRAPAFLTMFFIFENASSMGLRSGE